MALVHVDLGTGDFHTEVDAGTSDRFTAEGPIAAARIVQRHVIDAGGRKDPAFAPIVLVTGAAGGLPGPGLARVAAVGLSPLSGGIAESRSEGPFAAGMRRAGVTGIVLHGRSTAPATVVVGNGSVRLESARRLWGCETGAATDALVAEHGSRAAVAVIGPAGENGVRYASIVTCRDHQLARLGLGAVLGAKNVKAVVCLGEPGPAPDLSAFVRRYAEAIPGNQLAAWQSGAPGFAVWSAEPGYASVSNFRDTTTRSGVDPASAPPIERVAACPSCPNGCMKVYGGVALHQEALAMLGTGIGFDDPWSLHARCVQLGLDPVSFGGALAASGAKPSLSLAEDVARGGHPIGEGAQRLAAAGLTADEPMTSKGVELPPFDPRAQPNLGMAWAVSPIGPRYDIAEHDLDFVPGGLTYAFDEARSLGLSVPRLPLMLDPAGTAVLMTLWSGLDALGVCLFAATPTRPLLLRDVEDLVEAAVGERPDVMALGALRLRLQRDVNRRLGIGLDQDTLPSRFFTEPIQSGPWSGAVLDRDDFQAAVAVLHRQLGFGIEFEFDSETDRECA